MSKSTIIYVGGFSLPDKSASANRVVSNGKIFNSAGYRTVFLGNGPRGESFDGIRPVKGETDMFEQPYPNGSAQWARSLISTENICTLVEKYKDVSMIILYNLPVITLLKVKSRFAKTGIKVCYDCTEWSKDTDGSFLKRAFKIIDESFVRNFAHRISDGMIVISEMMKAKYNGKKPLVKLPPLVDADDEIWHQQPFKSEKPEFLFAGGLDGNKESLDKIVEAFNLLENEDAVLRIIGVTKDEFKSFYSVDETDINEKIVFMGRLSHKETVRYILSSGCYIFIRESDLRNNAGFPTKFVEAFTCGVKIITTDVSDVKKYLTDRCGILLNGVCVDEIRNAMNSLLNGGELKKENLRKDFHFEEYKNQVENWLEESGLR